MAREKQTFIEAVIEKYSSDIISTEESLDEIKDIEVIPTSSVALDVSLGVRGIPLGRLTCIYGPESSAKTSLCLSIVKKASQSNKNTLYIDVEQSLDSNYIHAIVGEYDKKKLVIAQPETMEQALDICEQGIDSGEFNLIIIDSIAALAPEKEKEDPLDKDHVGLLSRKLGQFFRRNMFKIRKNKIALICINQVRATIGTYVAGLEMPGGHAMRHFSSVIIMLNRAEKIEQNGEVVGSYSRFVVKKNKLSAPFKGFTFPLIYGKGIDEIRDTLDFSDMLGVTEKKGSYITFEGKTIAQGMNKTIEVLEADKELLDKIKEKLYNTVRKESNEQNDKNKENI